MGIQGGIDMSTMTKEHEKQIISKISYKLLPILILSYLLCYIDRVNVGYAALTMNQELGFTAQVYGMGAGILFFGYFVFEVPSNIMLEKYGARFWIARIMISWGIVSSCMCLVWNATSFYILRFLLGVCEAGFFPGVLLYISYWFPEKYRGVINSRFYVAQTFALMIGSACAGLILQMDGIFGLSGWKWLFLMEGIPTIIFGFVIYHYLIDRPNMASWLTIDERDWLQGELDAEAAKVDEKNEKEYSILQAMFHPRVLILSLTYLSLAVGLMGLNLWMPQIVKAFDANGMSNIEVGFIGAVPYLLAALGLIFIGGKATTPNRIKKIMGTAFILGGACLIMSTFTSSNLFITMALISICVVGGYIGQPLFWTIPPKFLTGTATAVGFAMINSVGNLGGFFGPYFIGFVKTATGSFENSLVVLGGCIILCGVLALYAFSKSQKELSLSAIVNNDNNSEQHA